MFERNTVCYSFSEAELQTIKKKMLNWLRPFSIFSYMDNNSYQHQPNRFEMIAGINSVASFETLNDSEGDWLFGHISYDYKNKIEQKLSSSHPGNFNFKDILFFKPETAIWIPFGKYELHIATLLESADVILQQILATDPEITPLKPLNTIPDWQYKFGQEQYESTVEQIRNHIEEGDCYELNFCTEAFAQNIELDPVYYFYQLNRINPSPFAGLYRNEDSWLLCASPERFLYKEGNEILSQPIKGTARRSVDAVQDAVIKLALLSDEKERAENVMIVDLVRNDLARSSKAGSVQVPELFGVYSFPQVHQLISTVTGTIKHDIDIQQIIEHAFPMGSMTGAPKIMVMQLIEQYEQSRRGLYSGSIGYKTPGGDFDFNVVIRSLFYQADSQYLSYQTGGAITYQSIAHKEWEEVRLKAKAMEQIFL